MSFLHDHIYGMRQNPYAVMAGVEGFLPPRLDWPVSAGYIGYATAHAPRGFKAARFAATAGTAAISYSTYYASHSMIVSLAKKGLLALFPEALAVRVLFGVIGLTLSKPENLLEGQIYKSFRMLSQSDKNRHRLEMGGDYTDTESNQTMRQAAVRDMTGAFGNARQFLGREARVLHQ